MSGRPTMTPSPSGTMVSLCSRTVGPPDEVAPMRRTIPSTACVVREGAGRPQLRTPGPSCADVMGRAKVPSGWGGTFAATRTLLFRGFPGQFARMMTAWPPALAIAMVSVVAEVTVRVLTTTGVR